jgi:hypothetical protein
MKVKLPKTCGSVSLEGQTYTPDKTGVVDVPDPAGRILLEKPYGCKLLDEPDEAEAEAKK